MCFSVNVNIVKEELENRFNATLIDHDYYRPSYYYHAFAIPEMPVVCSDDTSVIRLYKWGLIPLSTSDMTEADEIRMKTFNARGESLSKKPSFESSFRAKRCLVPVKGFYEWQHDGKNKIPWYIHHSGDEILSLAGLYDNWTDTASGKIFNTFTIITTDANQLLSEIHNSTRRMPVILNRESEREWLDQNSPESNLQELLRPLDDGILSAHTVSPLVNSRDAEKNTPEIIRPYSYPSQGSLF